MTAKTERITILGTPEFKDFLVREAKKEGISLSKLVRRRCQQQSLNEEEQLLMDLLAELRISTKRAEESLDSGLESMRQTLAEIRERKAA
ncbi:MAG: hypothetical protein KJ630_24405 [Proteobacteria bacterium]|nr:hypothetical protein [Pseudomonadota bacterium]